MATTGLGGRIVRSAFLHAVEIGWGGRRCASDGLARIDAELEGTAGDGRRGFGDAIFEIELRCFSGEKRIYI